jgi:hypothetical protein
MIKKWQSLVLAKMVRSFLGLVNLFIKDLSTLTRPFIDLLKKEGSFE